MKTRHVVSLGLATAMLASISAMSAADSPRTGSSPRTERADGAGAADGKRRFLMAVTKGDVVRGTAMLQADPTLITAVDPEGLTALHLAPSKEVADLLLAAKADVNARAPGNQTPLHEAARHGRVDVVAALLAHGADVDARESEKCTPLYFAVLYGRSEPVVALLIAHHADVAAENTIFLQPVHAAAYDDADRAGLIQALLAAGADANAKDMDSGRPLHYAAEQGAIRIAEALLAARAEVNARDIEKRTPLHRAAVQGRPEMVTWLLAHGADVNARDSEGATPLDHTSRERTDEVGTSTETEASLAAKKQIAQFLREHGAKTGQELGPATP